MRHPLFGLVTAFALLTGCAGREHFPGPPVAQAAAAPAGQARAQASMPSALDLLAAAIADHRLVLLGEIHGTREIPGLVGTLVERESARGKVILALEIIAKDQAGVDRYLRSSGSAADRSALLSGAHWREPTHDGRDSAAMLELIERMRRLRGQGRDVAIVFFDPGNVDDRDRGMAGNVRAVVAGAPDARVLALSGNVHAMTAAPPWEMFDGGKRIEPPMTAGRLLADLHPFSIDIEATTGDAWTCTGACGVHPVRAREARGAVPRLELYSPSESAWNAALLLPRFSASRPAIQ